MATSYLNIERPSEAGDAITADGWVSVFPTADTAIALNDISDDSPNGISVTFVANTGTDPGSNGSEMSGQGVASWAPAPALRGTIGTYSSSQYSIIRFSGLDDEKLYDLRFAASIAIAGRGISFQLDGANEKIIECYDDDLSAASRVGAIEYLSVSPASGVIDVEWEGINNSTGYLSALGISDEQPPTATLDNPLQVGESFSGTYNNFTGVPTGPVTISDGTRSITAPVTIADDASGGGTFSGTMPSFPAAGASDSAGSHIYPNLTADSISITLTDPGA